MPPTHRRRIFAAAVTILSIVAVFASILVLRRLGLLKPIDFLAYDALVRYRHRNPDFAFESPITVVAMTEQDIQALGHYPVTDQELAQLLTTILAAGPSAVGVDIFRDLEAPPGRAALDQLIRENPNLVFIARYGTDRLLIPPPPVITKEDLQGQTALADHSVDRLDHVVRRALIFFGSGQTVYPVLGAQVALIHLAEKNVPVEFTETGSRFGRSFFPNMDPEFGDYVRAEMGRQYPMDFRGLPKVNRVSFSEVLEQQASPQQFAGKIVMVGIEAESIRDQLPTPLDPQHWGVEIHAHMADQILRGAFLGHVPLRSLSNFTEAMWILFCTVLGAVLGLFLRRPLPFGLTIVAALGLLIGVVVVCFARGLWIPSVEPSLALFAAAAVVAPAVSQQERAERAMMARLFSQMQSPAVVDYVWQQRDALLEGGRLKSQAVTATVLFTDLKGFSTISESMSPGDLMNWLHEYLTEMSRIVEAHKGYVNKFIGDAVMAVFGAPVPSITPDEIAGDALAAVSTALEMRRTLAGLNRDFARRGLPTMQMRVGIMTGDLIAGGLGQNRLEYTVIGDTVNTASRLESHDKDLMDADIAADGCRILIGGATQELLGGRITTRFIGSAEVKGKSRKVDIYGVTGYGDSSASGGPHKVAQPTAWGIQ